MREVDYFTNEALMSYTQIFLMIVGLFAFSYVYGEFVDQDDLIIDYSNQDGLLNIFGDYLIGKLESGMVSAQVSGEGCCAVDLAGNTCQTAPLTDCNPDFQSAPTSCENTEFCEPGCCISPDTGLCNKRTSRAACEQEEGIFERGEACAIEECRLGCCIVGGESIWTTDANCAFEGNTQNRDLPTEWRQDVDSELQCLFIADANNEGACIYDDEDGSKGCVATNLDDCFKRTGSEANFYRDIFCSDSVLNTTCVAQDHKGCVTGEEDVFYFDSCGNKEDVSQDCDFYRGTYCGKDLLDYTCRDISCDTNGDGINDRANGESWCSYDSYIGDGKDTGGSRHIKHICNMGTERVAPCADFRNEICVQEDATLEGQTFSQAACRVNQWRTCLDFNKIKDEGSLKKKCEGNPDCWIKDIDMSGSFAFNVCLPEYPPGYDLLPDSLYDDNGNLNEAAYYQASSADGICDIGSLKCTETWICSIFGCVCADNCDCHTAKFTREMNDLCVGLGDCGSYINYIGKGTDTGYAVRARGGGGPPRLSSEQMGHSKYASQPAKPAPPGDFSFFETLNPELFPEANNQNGNSSLTPFERELLDSAGAYGSPLLLEILKQGADNETDLQNINSISAGSIGLSRFTGAISSAKAGILAQIGEYNDDKQDFSMVAAMVAGLIAFAITASILISMIAALLAFLIGLFWIIKVDIYFTCMPWDPPDGGADCNECNSLNVPCTEYRCESLGQLCTLINEGTGDDLCVSKPSNETLPVIRPFENAISPGYKYHNVGRDGFEVVNATDNGCLEPYEPVDIGIKVDPFAKCRVGPNSEDGFEDMFDAFGPKGNNVLPAHLLKLFFPSPEAFRNVYNLTDEQIKVLGKIDYYVKCRTASGKTNPEPYRIKTCIKPGPDLTPPRVILTRPLNGRFIPFGTIEEEIVVYVNEPSECRYDIRDLAFDQLNNTLECDTNPANYTLYGLACSTTISGLDVNDKFYIKCRDLSDNANTMEESFVYEVKRSESKLFIDEIIPRNGEVINAAVEPINTNFRLRTSGGALRGEALCRWEGNGYSDEFRYEEVNGSSVHEYELNSLAQGTYSINFICEDQAGNIAENVTSFKVNVDRFGPKITRVYFDGGLKVITSENADCRYSFLRNFKYDNATKMGSDGTNHFAGFLPKTYYVQCQDDLGNKGGRIRVKPYVSG